LECGGLTPQQRENQPWGTSRALREFSWRELHRKIGSELPRSKHFALVSTADAYVDLSLLHDEGDVFEQAYIRERVTVYGNDVGIFSGLNRAKQL
jgi:hypothetical protein